MAGARALQSTTREAPGNLLKQAEAWLQRWLKLEHGANILPVGHVAAYYVLLIALAIPGLVESSWVAAVAWLLLVILNYSLSIGILHMHGHRRLFTSDAANRVIELLLCFPCLHSYPTMRYVHVHLHHKYMDGEGDPTSTAAFRRGWKSVLYWIRYAPHCKWVTMRALFRRDAKPVWRRMRLQFAVDTIVSVSVATVWGVLDFWHMIWLWLLPLFVVWTNIGYFAWLTHAPAFKGDVDGSFNTPNRWMNLVIHNQGFHAVHHRHPAIHWTEIPDHLDIMLEVDDRLIVPHWVLLPCAWRVAVPGGLRCEGYAREWKRRYRARRGDRRLRMPIIPYFCWI